MSVGVLAAVFGLAPLTCVDIVSARRLHANSLNSQFWYQVPLTSLHTFVPAMAAAPPNALRASRSGRHIAPVKVDEKTQVESGEETLRDSEKQ